MKKFIFTRDYKSFPKGAIYNGEYSTEGNITYVVLDVDGVPQRITYSGSSLSFTEPFIEEYVKQDSVYEEKEHKLPPPPKDEKINGSINTTTQPVFTLKKVFITVAVLGGIFGLLKWTKVI